MAHSKISPVRPSVRPSIRSPSCLAVHPSVHRFVNLFAGRFAHLGRYRYLYRKLNILYIWERNSLQRCVHFVVVAFGNITIYITLCPKATCRSEGKPSCSQECRTNCMRQSGKLLTSRFTSWLQPAGVNRDSLFNHHHCCTDLSPIKGSHWTRNALFRGKGNVVYGGGRTGA